MIETQMHRIITLDYSSLVAGTRGSTHNHSSLCFWIRELRRSVGHRSISFFFYPPFLGKSHRNHDSC
ncbi:hypothetical protein M408DRAFT_263430 [Serendipita vermifera MAFF 305830]|uniref:Uncharacterized protein n=1 Tax=Serendipita vermifera MAFF 305830 TaxID=933852 RepID=A0A0C3AFL4_SERVB|nr:hypothetical protein M408DRAFT_263430 [Serendipita vermifera MAFF 305830]